MKTSKKLKTETDMQQFRELLSPIYDEFYKFIFSIMRNKSLTDDAVQNSLLIACQKLNTLKEPTKFKSWLFTIGKRESINILRLYQREVAYDVEIVEIISAFDDNLDDIVIRRENREYLLKLINELKDNYRDLIILRYYNELSFEEIAVTLNQNPSTVRSWHMRAKKRLLDKLNEKNM